VAVLALALWSQVSRRTASEVGAAHKADHADVLEVGRDYPAALPDAAAQHALVATPLPDNWDGRRPDYTGYVWYRIDAPADLPQRTRPAIYLPAAGMNAEVWLRGQRVGGAGRMQMPPSRHYYTPQLIELPKSLWAVSDRPEPLWVLVVGYPGYRSGLGSVWLGDHADLYPAWRWRSFWQNEGTSITSVINLTLAVLVLVIGRRDNMHVAYRWFGLAALVWALRNLIYVVQEPPLPDLLFAELCVAGAMWFIALFAIFAMHFAEANQPGYRGPRYLAPAALGYAVITTLYFVSANTYQRANAGFAVMGAVGIGFTLWTGWRLVRLAVLQPRLDLLAVAASAVVYLVLLVNDYAIAVDRQSLGEIYIRQYASLPLFVAITGTLARRYLHALRTTRELAESLQSQVQQQRELLAESFERVREAEREQARSQERSRLMGDLHDGLGLHLATALRQARTEQASNEQLVASLQDCMDDLRVAIDSLDEQERDPLALLGSLRFRMAPRFQSAGLSLAWTVAPDLGPLPSLDASGALDLLRIVQEALSNVLKHSGATEVGMALQVTAEGTLVTVSDNGCGFDPHTVAAGRGLGQLRARAQRLGARLNWQPGQPGMQMRLLLPHSI
jgi:signal transduction histidine kinase